MKIKKINKSEYTKELYDRMLEALIDATNDQCSDGNWNHDQYMHGMANGLIFACSCFGKGIPEYLEKPDVWLEDLPDPIIAEAH